MTRCGWHFALLSAVALQLWPASARAYEDQYTLGVGLGYAHAFPDQLPHSGGLMQLSASLGLDPIWTVRAVATAAFHPSDQSLLRALAGGELLYIIDILELVPSFGLGVDAVLTRVPASHEIEPDFAAHAVVGLDYLLSRELSLTFEARPHLLLTAWGDEPLYLTVSASLVWVFDR